MFFFFFKQKTAYEMRSSDWSSDVRSSDLKAQALQKLVNGELEAADYAELDNRLTGEREAIVAQQTKAQLTAEHNEQMQQGLFEHEMKRFLKTSSKDGIDYSDKADRGRFERAFALVAGDQANAEKGMDQQIGRAHF